MSFYSQEYPIIDFADFHDYELRVDNNLFYLLRDGAPIEFVNSTSFLNTLWSSEFSGLVEDNRNICGLGIRATNSGGSVS